MANINKAAVLKFYLDTQEYSDRLAAIEAEAASTLATQQTEVAAAIAQVNLAQSQTITALTLEVSNLKTDLTNSITATQTDLINRADQLAQDVTDITQQLTQDKAAFTQEIQDALDYLKDDASVASALRTPRKIQGVDFDGTQDISLPTFTSETDGLVPKRIGATADKYLREDGTWVVPTDTTYALLTKASAEDGTATAANTISAQVLKEAIQYHAPTVINIVGNAATATKLQTARTISLTGNITGSVNFDGSTNASIATTITGLGVANGIATLDANGQVPSTQLPSYVDDVLEYTHVAAFPSTGVAGKIYVETTGNTTYRWSGTTYVKITSGEVLSVAGKTGVVTLTKADVGLANVDNTLDAQKPISAATQLALNDKVDKEAGKGLSTNDYSNEDKTKVSLIDASGVGDKYLSDDGSYKTVSSGGGGGVTSVNAKTGVVVLNAADVGAVSAAGVVTEVNKFLKVGGTTKAAPTTHSSSSAVALGYNAKADGNNSIAIGWSTTAASTTSVAIGVGASVVGSYSGGIAIGSIANATNTGISLGASSKSTESSVAIGVYAQSENTTSTAIGALATTSTFANSTALGHQATVTASSQIQLGNSQTTTYAYGAVQDRSDFRDKADILDCTLGLEFINALRPVKYKWDYREDYASDLFPLLNREDFETDEAYQSALEQQQIEREKFFQEPVKDGSKTRSREHHGLIAQEFKQVLDNLGVDHAAYQDHSANGGMDIKSLGYVELIPNLIKAIQDLSAKVESLENGILPSSAD